MYEKQKMSVTEIAQKLNTYHNKIMRMLKKAGIKTRNKSEAQKLALQNGRAKNPCEGIELSEEHKQKIGESLQKFWEQAEPHEKRDRIVKNREVWSKKNKKEKKQFSKEGIEAIRKTSVIGSKLERYLVDGLTSKGYVVNHHKQFEDQHIDLFIDGEFGEFKGVAIEVNGPSHYEPIWGEDAFKRRVISDDKKMGLLQVLPCAVVIVEDRIGRPSKTSMRKVLEQIVELIEAFRGGFDDKINIVKVKEKK